ncbi:MAG: discoidin domain-containing protein [Cetobacterium sp.]
MYQELIYKFNFSRLKVAKEIELLTSGRVINATVKTEDSYGNTILNELKGVEVLEEKNILKFDAFYGKEYELTIYGTEISYENIRDIKVLEENQLQFKFGEDVPHENILDTVMDSSKMEASSTANTIGNNTTDKALDGNINTYFLGQKNEFDDEIDFFVDLGEAALINRIEFTTNSGEEGKVKNYKLLYKSFSGDEWKEIYAKSNEESTKKSCSFETVLAKEICIKSYESGENKIYISQIEILKYRSLKDEILGLFLENNKSQLADDVTQDMIVDLQERVIYTEDYMRMLEVASDLFIEKYSLNPISLEIPLAGESIINRISFKSSRDMIKSTLRYTDSLGIKRVKRLYWYVENKVDGIITIGVEEFVGKLRVHTTKAEILIYGTDEAELVEFETLPIERFSLRAESENKIDLDYSFFSEVNPEETLIIDREYIIDEIRLNTDEEVRVFLKDVGRSTRLSWDEYAEKQEYIEIGTVYNNSLKLPHRYFTKEIKLRSQSGRSYIKNLEIYQYNSIAEEVENLFTDDSYTNLKENVTLDIILDVESRIKIDGKYIEKVKLAKTLFVQNNLIEEIEFNFESERILDEIKFITLGNPYRVEVIYQNPSGDILRKDCKFKIDDEEVTVEIGKIYATKLEMKVHGLDRVYKAKMNSYSMNDYLVGTDMDEEFSILENIEDIKTVQNGIYTDYKITLFKEELVYKFKANSKADIFIKDVFSGEYIEFKEDAGVLETKKSYLIKEFIYRAYNNLSKESVLEGLKAYKISKVKLALDNLFKDSECTQISDFVTYDYILDLEKAIVSNNEYLVKVRKAKDMFTSGLECIEQIIYPNSNLTVNGMIINLNENLENRFECKLFFKDFNENFIEIENIVMNDLSSKKEIELRFAGISSKELKLTLKLSESESWKFAVAYEDYKELSTK